jgi:D-glycero-alpha-D-manno-heptose 1-phosphate guanylyltransferase
MDAIVLAGGFGTRLQPAVSDLPKSMALVNGRPFLEYLLDRLIQAGIDHIVLSVGYKAEHIIEKFQSEYRKTKISYALESKPLGTGGGVKLAMQQAVSDDVLILNGDTLFMLDIKSFADFHYNTGSLFSLALRQVDSVDRYGSVTINGSGIITGFAEKNSTEGPGLINAGMYMISKKYFTGCNLPEVFSLEKDFIEKIYLTDHLYGFPASDYFIDIGIPEDYLRAQTEFRQLPAGI